MTDTYYMISEASKLVHVESHVLRYWEEELGLEILRNELGHRVYSADDIRLFNVVRILKEKGYQLKAIRELLPHLRGLDESEVSHFQDIHFDPVVEENGRTETEEINITDNLGKEQLEQFEKLLGDIIYRALERYELSHPVREELPVELSEKSLGVLTGRIEELMDRLEEREEERFRLLDECIRSCQKVNQGQRKRSIAVFLRSLVT